MSDIEPYEGFVMPCGRRFETEVAALLHAEGCGICIADLNEAYDAYEEVPEENFWDDRTTPGRNG